MRCAIGVWGAVAVCLAGGCGGNRPAVVGPAAPAWQQIDKVDAGFRVSMPGTPREEIKQMPRASQLQLILNMGDPLYLVTANEVPAGADQADKADHLLDVSRDRSVSNSKGKLLQEKRLTLDNRWHGREYEILTEANNIRRQRLYLAQGRLYALVVVGSREKTGSPDADRFLDSFKLIAK
jgi:hypothetical protein